MHFAQVKLLLNYLFYFKNKLKNTCTVSKLVVPLQRN